MGRRKSLSKKTRFEVFKRDSFTCQYCGRSAPDVVLEVDHINPIAEGGDDSIINYITSCFDCNRGKGKRKLNDKTELEKQRQQLKELNEKRLQLQMMMDWRKELLNIKGEETKKACEYWSKLMNGQYSLNEKGKTDLQGFLKKYLFKEVIEAMEKSANKYLEIDNKGKLTQESVEKVFNYIPKICNGARLDAEKPYMKDLFYIRGILRNRLNYCDEHLALSWLTEAYDFGYTVETLKSVALECNSWSQFRQMMETMVRG
jgi:hypothetical protein